MRRVGGKETDIRPNAYSPGGFHPVHIGDLYNNRYLVLRKLGYGISSTVWLVLHVYRKKYYAMKVLSAEYGGTYGPILEDEILHCLRAGEHHICLVFVVMGETLRGFAKRLRARSEQGVSAKFVKKIVKQLLLALDNSHNG